MSLAEQRRAAADQEFAAYRFADLADEDGPTVKDANPWEGEGADRLIRTVFFEAGDGPSAMGQFTVDFAPGQAAVVDACATLDGDDIGERGAAVSGPTLSRDAQILAYCLFGMGKVSSVTFERPHIITPRALAALEELTASGRIAPKDARTLPRGAKGWQATEAIGNPWRDYAKPGEGESFPLTTE